MRYEIVFEDRVSLKDAFSGVVSGLRTLSARSSSLLGDAYASAAGAFLERKERLQDLTAERRQRQRRARTQPKTLASSRQKTIALPGK